MTPTLPTETMNKADLQRRFKVSKRMVDKWMSEGAIGYFKRSGVVRFSEEDVLQFYLSHHKDSHRLEHAVPDVWAKLNQFLWLERHKA